MIQDNAQQRGLQVTIDFESLSPSRLSGMGYWVMNCKNRGLVCGSWPDGNCNDCVSGMIPPSLDELRRLEIEDQPEDATPPVLNLKTHRWFPKPTENLGITHAGWWRVYNGTYVWSWWNVVRTDKDWVDDVSYLQSLGLSVFRHDPDNPLKPGTTMKDIVDRGPGLYIKPAGVDGPAINVTDVRSMEEIENKVEESDLGYPLTERRLYCNYCGVREKMEKRADGRSWCRSCGTRRTIKASTRKRSSNNHTRTSKKTTGVTR